MLLAYIYRSITHRVHFLDHLWGLAHLRQIFVRRCRGLTEEEIHQWCRAKCRKLAAYWHWTAWPTPLMIDEKIAGYALFVGYSDGDPNEAPILEGVFEQPQRGDRPDLRQFNSVIGMLRIRIDVLREPQNCIGVGAVCRCEHPST